MKSHICEFFVRLNKGGGKFLSIKAYRKRAGMTQVQLAKKMNVDQSAVSLWERGETKPLKKYRKKLEKVLGCTEDELLAEDEEW